MHQKPHLFQVKIQISALEAVRPYYKILDQSLGGREIVRAWGMSGGYVRGKCPLCPTLLPRRGGDSRRRAIVAVLFFALLRCVVTF